MTTQRDAGASASQRRGAQLRNHVLLAAKDVFLETGYERTSMDAVAARAQTSKRSLYAHFESKEKLFAAVLALIGEMYLDQLRTPDAYADEPVAAVTLFCARFAELLVWDRSLRTCRLSIAEAQRLPGSSSPYYEAIFTTTYARLATYLTTSCAVEQASAEPLARELLDRTALPRLFRALLGIDPVPADLPDETVLADDPHLPHIRAAVVELLADAAGRPALRSAARR
ncbi:TetR/AcrR family transcriptional regulator [uncultured Jatrophihabitans sp.]|uniref:TetR/AcrR family transcriptional regulator n=1 Tax=uncultured Jatrophihabitans sp. TaxID=1610747 RepID=UPI0035CAF068